jgi:flagellar basal body-associated protein FliL
VTGASSVLAVVGQVAADSGDDASQRLSMVIIGLVVLAVVIAVATVVFWRLTKPDPAAREGGIRWVNAPEGVAPPAPAAPATPPRADDGTASGAPPAAG